MFISEIIVARVFAIIYSQTSFTLRRVGVGNFGS